MANVEDRVISIAWESERFITGVSSTLSSLDKLNAALKKVGIDNGLDNIEKSANKITFGGLGTAIDKIKSKFGRGFPEADQAFSEVEKGSGKIGFTGLTSAIDKLKGQFSHIPAGAGEAFAGVEQASGKVEFHGLSQAIDQISGKFSILEGAASVALGNIASKAAMAGGNWVKSLSLTPILDGFKEYETQIGATQTILANTQASGATLKDVGAALNDLNHYADKTIYNFTEMTKNIGTFTAAGVDLQTATGSIKGIANLAALSGSNAQQASTAMYQLSQAISSGRVSLQDWNSVVNAGMGGTVFQRALAQTATKMGTLSDGAVKLTGKMKNVTIHGNSFRESITAKPGEKSWLTSDVLTKTLQHFTGDLSDAQLAAEGFSKSEIKAIQSQAKVATDAATKVKTFSQLVDTTKEAIGSGWSQTFQIIFGDFKEAGVLFTNVSNVINGFVGNSSKARNQMLTDWKKLGGRDELLSGLKTAFRDLSAVIKPVHDAFRDIFPAKTGKDLFDLTVRFRDFMRSLRIGPDTADNLRSTFKGFFAVLDIGKQIVGGVFTAIGHMFGAIGNGSGGILSLTGNLGELLVKLDQWLKKGDKIKGVFAGLGDVLATPINLIGNLTSKLNGLFSGVKTGGATSALSGIGSSLGPASKAADAAKSAWSGFLKIVGKVADALGPVAQAVAESFGNLSSAIADALRNNNWDAVFQVIQTGLIAGIFLTIKKAISGGLNFDIGGGVLKNLSGSLDVLRGSLVDIQRNIQAHTLLLIATSVGVLAASVVALSLVKPAKLANAMTAITVAMGQLMAGMAIMSKLAKSSISTGVVAGSLILLAAAIDTLAVAVLILSRLSWDELARGLAGTVALLAAVSVAVIPLSKGGPGMILTGVGLIAVGTGLNILAGAVKIFSTMDWGDMARGLAGVVLALAAVSLTMKTMPLTLPITGAGLILVGVGLSAVGAAVKVFASLDLKSIAKGIGGIAASLIVIAVAMNAMPATLPITAAGLILVGIGLTAVAGAIGLMGSFKLGTLVKGIAGIAGVLVVLAVGLTAMVAALPGAAALLVAAGALAILAPVLGVLGHMSWAVIAKGLEVVAISLGVIAAAGLIATPGLIALGGALVVFGAGVTVTAAGVYLMAKGLLMLAGPGAKGLAVFIAAMTGMIAILPKVIISFLQGLVQMVAGIAKLAPLLVESFGKIILTLLDVVIKAAPKMAEAATALITAIITTLSKNGGPIIAAGWKLLTQLLSGLDTHISQVTKTAANVVVKFLGAIASKAASIATAGVNVLAKFLTGIANGVSKVATAAINIVTRFVGAIALSQSKVIAAGASMIVKVVSGIMNSMGRVITAGATAIIKFVSGLEKNFERVVSAGVTLVARLINAVSKQSLRMADEGAKAIIQFLHGVAAVIRQREPEMIAAGADIGKAIVQGMIGGVGQLGGSLLDRVSSLISSLPKAAKKLLGINSPSLVFHAIGSGVVEGLTNGINITGPTAVAASANVVQNVIKKAQAVVLAGSGPIGSVGAQLMGDFAKGLRGSEDDVVQSFDGLDAKVKESMGTILQTISQERDRLKELSKDRKKNKEAIDSVTDSLTSNEAVLAKLLNTHTLLMKGLGDHKAGLVELAKQYADITTKLDDAKQALADAIQTRDDAAKGFADQYDALPDIVKTDADGNPIADQLGAYSQSISDQATAVAAYKDTLDQLRALGLDDKTYQKLLSDGTADQDFANQLLSGGRTAVDGLNGLDAQLDTVSKSLGTTAAKNLYQAGVDTAQGLIDGLKSKKTELEGTIDRIADDVVTRIKKKLKIKSPSQVFAEVGRFASLGLAKGLADSSGNVADAASSIADDAVRAMRDSMGQLSSAIGSEIDSNPTITPILDLSKVQYGVKQLGRMTSLSPAASYGLAAGVDISNASSPSSADSVAPAVQFNQYNNSPKALSEIELYRQTNNQLSQAKRALGL